MLRSLRYRDFRRFWVGFGVATLGFQVQRVGLGSLAYDLTGSAFYLALVFSGDSIPMLFLSPVGGVLSDRLDRKTVLMASRCVVAVLAFGIALLVWSGGIQAWHLLLFALATGTCYAIDVPARQAMVHDLVPSGDFVNAVALTSTVRQVSRIVGPALGSLALLALGTQGTFTFMAVAQVLSVATVALVHLPRRVRVQRASARANLVEGLRFVARHDVIRLLLIVSAVPAMSAMAYQSLTPVFAESVLDRGSAAIGVMLSAAGAGALAG
ncbi:MAG: MFS transporter, partial [Dehalococcoidia bacterium]